MDDEPKNLKAVYTVVERGQGKSFWIRVGTGYTNRDGSLNLRLDAVPVNGRLQVREWEPTERRTETLEAHPKAKADPPSRALDAPALDAQPVPRPRSRESAPTPSV